MSKREIILGNCIAACALTLLFSAHVWAAGTARELAERLSHATQVEPATISVAVLALAK